MDAPGVYKMIDESMKVIYVGKAKSLKKRLLSYTRTTNMNNRLKMMISLIHKIEYIKTMTEIEALILESNLIKEFKPFFNILLKDDKSYPYIVIDEQSDFPRIFKYRTNKPKGKNFHGPYPLVASLSETIKVIQKTFLIRTCTDNYFKSRNRPCLQYFVKRCSAPCVNRISIDDYRKNVKFAEKLLEGEDEVARKMLVNEMRKAAEELDFEKAARIRDRITAISEIQSKQYAIIDNTASTDIVTIVNGPTQSIIGITFFRSGKNVGFETIVMENSLESNTLEIFLTQFYKNIQVPKYIVTPLRIENKDAISKFLGTKIIDNPNSNYKKIIENAISNSKSKLNREISNEYSKELEQLEKLASCEKINRIEVYDNSHIMGSNACGAMIVFENGMLRPNLYRKFNIDKVTANHGDDLAMMKFVLNKRFQSKNIPEIPELIIIDGGNTQLRAAIESPHPETAKIISIAKQNDRKMGDEKIITEGGKEIFLQKNSELLNFLIMLRNEAHKTAITFHRKKQLKSMNKSVLDEIPTIGSIRKKKLLEHFGSILAIKGASIDDIISIRGIDKKSAQIVFDFFNKSRT